MFLNYLLCIGEIGISNFPWRRHSLLYTIFLDNDPVWFVLTNVEREPMSNFSDNLEHFQTTGFGVIGLNRPILGKLLYVCIYQYFCCNASIQKLRDINV